MYFNNIACRDCSQRSRCTTSKRDPRRIRRWVHEAEVEDMQARLNASPQTAVVRKQTVEHPFGTIKIWMGAPHFLTQRFKNVSTEISLHLLAYNLKRMMSIWGTEGLAISTPYQAIKSRFASIYKSLRMQPISGISCIPAGVIPQIMQNPCLNSLCQERTLPLPISINYTVANYNLSGWHCTYIRC